MRSYLLILLLLVTSGLGNPISISSNNLVTSRPDNPIFFSTNKASNTINTIENVGFVVHTIR